MANFKISTYGAICLTVMMRGVTRGGGCNQIKPQLGHGARHFVGFGDQISISKSSHIPTMLWGGIPLTPRPSH